MGRDYRNFMRMLLTREPGEPTLFEPFIDSRIAEQLIWRRGKHLWNTPELYIDTLAALNERTVSDVIVADTRGFGASLDALYETINGYADDHMAFICLCDTMESAKRADLCGGVCAVAVYGNVKSKKPMIKMDGLPEDAIVSGCAGWFAPCDAERYWAEYGDKIAILGGLGVPYLTSTGPVTIHTRCEKLYDRTKNVRYALGSGGCMPQENYLEFISMLGIYKKYKL